MGSPPGFVGTAGIMGKAVLLELYHRKTCAICGLFMPVEERTLDHVVPPSKGGPNHIANLQTVHGVCDSRKYNRLPE